MLSVIFWPLSDDGLAGDGPDALPLLDVELAELDVDRDFVTVDALEM